jgi:hypothetical protein
MGVEAGVAAGSFGGGGGVGRFFRAVLSDARWLLGEAYELLKVVVELMTFVLAIRLMRSKNGLERFEGAGYLVWAIALWAFAIPELYGAFAGHNGRVPTLSNTVGNILYSANELSFDVVGVVVLGVMHAVRVQLPARQQVQDVPPDTPVGAHRKAVPRGRSGRLAPTDPQTVLPIVAWYYPVAGAIVVAAFLVPILTGASKQHVGEWGYGALGVVLFLIPGVLAYRHARLVPFPTLFTTFLDLERRSPPLAIVVGTGLVFLMIHLILYPFPAIIPDLQGFHHHCQQTPRPAICTK